MKWAIALIYGAFAPLLYCNTFEVQGYFNGVSSTEIYAEGSEHYCLKPIGSTGVTVELSSDEFACIYLAYGNVLASTCDINPSFSVTGLSDNVYKIILASNVEHSYSLYVTSSGEFDRCTDYYQAGYLGVSIDQINFVLLLAGVLSAIGFYSAITYVILTLGNF
ncbi:MAG: hypothetical protein RBR54_06125 [Sulfurimonas sp.]|jgi:hypothetical protein|nr:hypothetical protein [Sulfurimonas sp.]